MFHLLLAFTISSVVVIMPASQTKKSNASSTKEFALSTLAMADRHIASNWPDLFFALRFHRTTHNEPLDFGLGRHPLIQLYKDDSQHVVVMKAVQIGITDRMIIAALSRAYRGWAVLYSFPTDQFRNEQVAERIDPLLKSVSFYRAGIKHARGEKDEVGMKHFWNGVIRFVGSNSKVSFVGFAADMLIIDEKDRSDLDNLKLAPDRLDASKFKYYWRVGNPSYPRFGIHQDYLESDQKVWMVKCDHCGEWQPLDFFVNGVEEIAEGEYRLRDSKWTTTVDRDIFLLCRKCEQPLNRLGPGEYVAKQPDRSVSGYHLSQLTSPTKTIRDIYDQFQKGLTDATEMQIFYNSRLGLPYEGSGEKITAALLDAKCKDDYQMPSTAKGCTAGVDVNWPQLNVRISDYPERHIRRAVYIGIVHSFDELSNLLQRYDVQVCCIDAAPERHKVAEFQAVHANVWSVDYAKEEINEFWRLKEDLRHISVDRTQSIDNMISEILKGNNRLPKNFRSLDGGDYVAQMEAPTRRFVESRRRYVWDEGDQPDHHFHADNYDCLAARILMDKPTLWITLA